MVRGGNLIRARQKKGKRLEPAKTGLGSEKSGSSQHFTEMPGNCSGGEENK